jgi:3-hydroxyisobutyrate dehydrogenase-like beta-hydroxyacid dehydrogenase
MGAGLGWALREGDLRVLSTVDGRSARTVRLAEAAGLELLPTLADVVAASDVVLLVTPPGDALDAARAVASAASSTGARPLVADLNAVSPSTMHAIADVLAPLDVVDGSISGPPPTVRPGANVYLSGNRAGELAALPWGDRVRPSVIGDTVGTASALKMCTASVYKGLVGLFTQAMRTAARHGVLDEVLADLRQSGLDHTRGVAMAATKAHRFVAEMHEISVTQRKAGLTPALFEAFAEVFADVAQSDLAHDDPESIGREVVPADVVAGLARRASPKQGGMAKPLLDLG